MLKRRRYLWLGGVLLLVLTVSIFTGKTLLRNRGNGASSKEETDFRAGPTTELLEEISYTGCGHILTEKKELPGVQQGLTLKQLADLYPAWNVTAVKDNVWLKASHPGLCPTCKQRLYVGLAGEEVAVFYGTPGGPSELKEHTGISAAGLPQDALLDLKAGIPIENQEQLSQILEGLMN